MEASSPLTTILIEEGFSRMRLTVVEHHTQMRIPTVELFVLVVLMQSVQAVKLALEECLVRQTYQQDQLVRIDFL